MCFSQDIMDQRSPRWLSFLGTSGAGKTMLAKFIWHVFRDNFHGITNWEKSNRTQTDDNPWGRIVRDRGGFIKWGDAINKRMLKGDYDFLDDLRSYDFFVIDDIAAEYEKHRALSASKLYDVFDNRLKKWTVITANLSLQQISEQYDPRIASRMLRDGSIVVDVDVVDYNLRAIPSPIR